MIFMAQFTGSFPLCMAGVGSFLGIVGGVVAASPPDPGTGTAGLYVGAAGIVMAAATLIGVMGDKLGPHMVEIIKIRAENREENRKNKEARHRLMHELQKALAQIENQKYDHDVAIEELRRKANESENLAIEAKAHARAVEENARREIADARRGIARNSGRLDNIEAKSSDDALPFPMPATPDPDGPPAPAPSSDSAPGAAS
jgi:hypothetical protein